MIHFVYIFFYRGHKITILIVYDTMSTIREASTNSPVEDAAKRLNKLQVNKIKKAVSLIVILSL